MRRLETEKDNDDMITLVKVELNLPTNTTLSTVEDKNISPLKNAAGVTRTEVRELQKKEKEAVIKILVNKIEESNPSNSTSVQTWLESGSHLSINDGKDKKPSNVGLTSIEAAVQTGYDAQNGEKGEDI